MSLPELPPGLLGPDAPAPGACVRIERPEKGLAVLVLDPPHRKQAVLDMALMRDLASALEKMAQDGGLEGLVITGREPTRFAVGADLDALAEQTDAQVVERLAAYGQAVYGRIAALRARTVAAVGGPVPGGAYELCLACDVVLACDDPTTRIGLPETQLGILPGWGGSQRLPRRVGVPTALEAILTGKLYPARAAQKRGLVDRLTQPELLRRIAGEIALGRTRVRRHRRGAWAWLIDRNPLALAVIGRAARADVAKRTQGHYPAPPRALELVLAAPRTPLAQGLAAEARALGELGVTAVCKHLIGIFRMSEDAKKLARLPEGEPRTIERAGVVGAGVMGGAIAGLLAERGVDTRLADLAAPALDAAVLEHRATVARS
ncbi:MAG TPA: enoyl-CoA hydratase-related protein, partial [Planctomycetota bacterium]|nr:enoyl-CoA hydratase-related protein [Planctomycetota bacterium]